MDAFWCGGILCSDDREQEGILSRFVYLHVNVDVYLPAGAIHDPAEGEGARGGLEAESVRVDVCLQVVPLLGCTLLDPEGEKVP